MSQDIVSIENDYIEPIGRWSAIRGGLAKKAGTIESSFLTLLRYSALGIAALTLVCAAVILAYGFVQQLGRTKVDPQDVSIDVSDIVPPEAGGGAMSTKPGAPRKVVVGKDVRDKTLQLYRGHFQRFERPGTKIEPQAIVDLIWPEERIQGFKTLGNGHLLDKAGNALTGGEAVERDSLAMVEAAIKEGSFDRQLITYRDAKKVQVCTEKFVTRTREESYWDSFSTSCENWASSPIGCMSSRTIREPSVENVCEMKFPENIESPAQTFASSIQRYREAGEEKLGRAHRAAIEQTLRNSERKLEGQGNMLTGGQLFLGFLGIMFLYLLIALERHHRNLMRFAVREP